MPTAPEVPLAEQLKCAKRELALRRSAYPRWVGAKRMTQDKADAEIAAMAAIVKTLERFVDNEPYYLTGEKFRA